MMGETVAGGGGVERAQERGGWPCKEPLLKRGVGSEQRWEPQGAHLLGTCLVELYDHSSQTPAKGCPRILPRFYRQNHNFCAPKLYPGAMRLACAFVLASLSGPGGSPYYVAAAAAAAGAAADATHSIQRQLGDAGGGTTAGGTDDGGASSTDGEEKKKEGAGAGDGQGVADGQGGEVKGHRWPRRPGHPPSIAATPHPP